MVAYANVMKRFIVSHLRAIPTFPSISLIVVGFLILGNEFLKEGYFFNFSDIFVPRFTHEKFVLAVLLVELWVNHRKAKGIH